MRRRSGGKEGERVEYQDKQGRKCIIQQNSANNLDLHIDGRMKVQQLKDVCPGVDHTIHFDGRGLNYLDKTTTVCGKDKDETLQKIMDLVQKCNKARTKKKVRCFVKIVRGSNLRAADVGGKSDPYVICRIHRSKDGEEQKLDGNESKTKFKSRTLDPVWNEDLEIEHFDFGAALEFVVMDHDYLSAHDFLGHALIYGDKLQAQERSKFSFEGELKLSDDGHHGGKKAKGSIHVKVMVASEDGEGTQRLDDSPAPAPEKPKSVAQMGQDPEEQKRRDLVEAVFRLLAEHEGHGAEDEILDEITSFQVRKLARLLGFHCEAKEFQEEFEAICTENRWPETNKLNAEQLFQLLSPSSNEPCSTKLLQDIHQELSLVKADPHRKLHVQDRWWKPQKRIQGLLNGKAREELIREVFQALDVDAKENYLTLNEMKQYAYLCGFSGSDDEWMMEWAEICEEQGVNAKEGIDKAKFMQLVDDSNGSAHSDNAELRMCLGALAKQGALASTNITRDHHWKMRTKTMEFRSQRPREELMRVLFDTLDESETGTLQQQQVRRVASLCGWQGTDTEWAEQWGGICHDFNINANGATFAQFKRLLDKKANMQDADGGELSEMITDVAESREQLMASIQVQTDHGRRKVFAKKRSWADTSDNYQNLRTLSLFLRKKFRNDDEAYLYFADDRPFARLTKEDFLNSLRHLEFEGNGEEAWKLMALGSQHLVNKHFKWLWGLLEAEELVHAMSRLDLGDKESLRQSLQKPRGDDYVYSEPRRRPQPRLSQQEDDERGSGRHGGSKGSGSGMHEDRQSQNKGREVDRIGTETTGDLVWKPAPVSRTSMEKEASPTLRKWLVEGRSLDASQEANVNEKVEFMLQQLDADASGTLSRDELRAKMEHEKAEKLMASLDTDENGQITREELRAGLQQIVAKGYPGFFDDGEIQAGNQLCVHD